MLAEREIVERFLENSRQVHPDVVAYIREQNDPRLIDRILHSVPPDRPVVSPRDIPALQAVRDKVRFCTDPEIEVLAGGPGHARPCGDFMTAVRYFRGRYDRLSEIIRQRAPSMPIEALKASPSRYRNHECTICGIVSGVRTTASGHRMVEIEDNTATIRVLFNRRNDDLFADAETIVPDEVIGVRGRLSDDGNLFFAGQLIRPEIPPSHAPYRSERDGKAVLISDIHLGSRTFLEEEWNRFADWLSDSDASYLLIAGDIVDGIGIYPGQEKELSIRNIYEQYDRVGELLSDLPSRIAIVVAPGNHDVVRGAEPQPVIPEEFRGSFPGNCRFVENPALISLQGVRVLMYHGRSFDDLISMIPGASYQEAYRIMVEMLRRRHLAPSYGGRTPLAASPEDRLVIDPIPEVLHTGHVHIAGITRYRGVLCVNAGAWQAQTSFQKQMNIQPTPARAVVVDLRTLEPRMVDFSRPVSG
ncbi:MAG: DNA-directed DNA polymerase II small subunit [Methanoculleaceae archaeon]